MWKNYLQVHKVVTTKLKTVFKTIYLVNKETKKCNTLSDILPDPINMMSIPKKTDSMHSCTHNIVTYRAPNSLVWSLYFNIELF